MCLSTNGERALNYTVVNWLILTINTQATKLVVCLSTNGERALNYTIVKWLILTTNTQATKIKSSF